MSREYMVLSYRSNAMSCVTINSIYRADASISDTVVTVYHGQHACIDKKLIIVHQTQCSIYLQYLYWVYACSSSLALIINLEDLVASETSM